MVLHALDPGSLEGCGEEGCVCVWWWRRWTPFLRGVRRVVQVKLSMDVFVRERLVDADSVHFTLIFVFSQAKGDVFLRASGLTLRKVNASRILSAVYSCLGYIILSSSAASDLFRRILFTLGRQLWATRPAISLTKHAACPFECDIMRSR